MPVTAPRRELVIDELAPPGHEPDPPEQATAHQTIVNAFFLTPPGRGGSRSGLDAL
ncbi:hypothetical protein AB0G71_25500 [Streptomyces sp. NPDC020403]|uniref:hypothetical protein n=1 Tax=unclassified Streptomyces TaxID=2593676 RepID=UPI0033E62EE8